MTAPPTRLHLLVPPALVGVRGPDGALRPALLQGRRGERCFVSVHHAPGDNRLGWVDAGAVGDVVGAGAAAYAPSVSGAVALSRPRAQR